MSRLAHQAKSFVRCCKKKKTAYRRPHTLILRLAYDRDALTVLSNEDVEHWQDLAVVRHKSLADKPLPLGPLITSHQRLEDLENLDDDTLLSCVQCRCVRTEAR